LPSFYLGRHAEANSETAIYGVGILVNQNYKYIEKTEF